VDFLTFERRAVVLRAVLLGILIIYIIKKTRPMRFYLKF
jgi:hypothetical protein